MKLHYKSCFTQTTFLLAVLCRAAYSNAFLGNETDYKALLAIKSKLMNDDGGVLMSWNHSLHHCSWVGVTCGPKHNRVIQLYFDDKGLRGTISPFIGNLSFLRKIGLSNNSLSGSIPPEIGRLWRLQVMSLDNNTLSGEIPANISGCINLQNLALSYNHLHGELPMGLGTLPNLKYLRIYSNELVGPLFKVLANLTSLEVIYAYENGFTGNIPDSISRMTNLTLLNLHFNKISGIIPPSIFNLSSLQELYLCTNQLRGSIPPFISSSTLPQLQRLSLFENNLSGPLPTSIQNLTILQVINLNTNNFTGHVSINFGHLNSLQWLRLDSNNLDGDINFIITTLLNCTQLKMLDLHNNYFRGVLHKRLCGGILQLHLPRCVEKGRMSRALMLAISITSAIFGVLTIATCIWLYLQSRKRRRKSLVSHSLVKKPFLKVSYDMLLKATDGFSLENLLGSGAFGSVYKGVLDGITIAVKVLNLHYRDGSKSFTRECEVLRKICHRNLVGIITVCSSIDFQGNEFKALVFEYMSNGNLESWLHQDGNLSLLQRVDIAIDVAHALNYIHHECENPIAHCDLKPSNVLLDHDMVAHVADFGLAKALAQPLHPNQSTSIGARGTIGYVAPEYGMGSEASLVADLYSFGILLLELMTRKRPTDDMFNEDLNLHMYAKAALPDQVLHIVDSSMLIEDANEEVDSGVSRLNERLQQREKCISFVIMIGVACSRQLPSDRMKMSEAISELQKARNIIHNPKHNLPRGA